MPATQNLRLCELRARVYTLTPDLREQIYSRAGVLELVEKEESLLSIGLANYIDMPNHSVFRAYLQCSKIMNPSILRKKYDAIEYIVRAYDDLNQREYAFKRLHLEIIEPRKAIITYAQTHDDARAFGIALNYMHPCVRIYAMARIYPLGNKNIYARFKYLIPADLPDYFTSALVHGKEMRVFARIEDCIHENRAISNELKEYAQFSRMVILLLFKYKHYAVLEQLDLRALGIMGMISWLDGAQRIEALNWLIQRVNPVVCVYVDIYDLRDLPFIHWLRRHEIRMQYTGFVDTELHRKIIGHYGIVVNCVPEHISPEFYEVYGIPREVPRHFFRPPYFYAIGDYRVMRAFKKCGYEINADELYVQCTSEFHRCELIKASYAYYPLSDIDKKIRAALDERQIECAALLVLMYN
jgi:hypothetical protein